MSLIITTIIITNNHIQVKDFSKILYERPGDTLACISLGVSLILGLNPHVGCTGLVARFINVEPLVPLASLKSGIVWRFVSVKGTVARCSAIRPLVLEAEFECPKCGR